MKSHKENKFEIFCFLDFLVNSEEDVDKMLNTLEEIEDICFAGFQDKEFAKSFMKRFILDKNGEDQFFEADENLIGDVIDVSKKTLVELDKYYKDKMYLFIFPCFNKFIVEKMKGLGGFCSWNNVVLIFLNPQENWEVSLKETIAHELAHAVSPFYNGGEFSVGEGLIFDGLAEHFRENIIGGEHAPFSKALNESQIKEIFKEINPNLNSMDFDFYFEVFFGTGKYPNWAGYTIGYYLIKEYLKDKKNIDWNKLLRMNPQEILDTIIL